MASSMQSPALRFASNEIILGLHKEITKVTQFTTDFSAEAATKGSTMMIPIMLDNAAENFNRATNNYGTINGSMMYTPMTFDINPKHSFGFTEADFNLANGTQFWSKSSVASANSISRRIAEEVGKLIHPDFIKTSGKDGTEWVDADGEALKVEQPTFSAANEFNIGEGELTKLTVAKLRVACKNAGIPVSDTILALTSEKFAELLSLLDANMYGGTEAIRLGMIPGLYGYKAVMEFDEIASGVGALIPASSIAVASRVKQIQNAHLYQEVGTTTDENSGLVIQMRRGGDWTTGDAVATAECLMGTKLIQPTKVVRLIADAA